MRKLALTLATAAVAVVGGYGATSHGAAADTTLPPNWHVHDGQVALGPQHKGIGFFPRILGISTSQYVQDPARCPNATDKAFLPSSGEAQSDLLRAGICETSTDVIHLRTVLLGTSGPDGWSSLTTPAEPGWVTYYLVTAQ